MFGDDIAGAAAATTLLALLAAAELSLSSSSGPPLRFSAGATVSSFAFCTCAAIAPTVSSMESSRAVAPFSCAFVAAFASFSSRSVETELSAAPVSIATERERLPGPPSPAMRAAAGFVAAIFFLDEERI